MHRPLAAALTLLISAPAAAQTLDHDSLLTDAPATPEASTIRFAGIGSGTTQTDSSGSLISGTVMWAPIDRLALDIGGYYQAGTGGGPSARARFQLLKQGDEGIDLAAGLRFKTVGFDPKSGELEMIVSGGRRFGDFDLVLNGVFGVETGGPGKDLEVKGFAGYHFGERLRVGLDGRIQVEMGDADADRVAGGRSYDLTAGPGLSWLVTPSLQLQALGGISAPIRTTVIAPLAMLGVSIDL
jgi:hypothetical protein